MGLAAELGPQRRALQQGQHHRQTKTGNQPQATGQGDQEGCERSQNSAAPLTQLTISLCPTAHATKGCQANAKQLLKQPVSCHHRSQATKVNLLLKGGVGLGGDAFKKPAEPNVLERLKRRLAAAVIEAEVEPLRTHPDRVGHRLQLNFLGKVMGKITSSPVHYIKLLGGTHRDASAAARQAMRSTDKCRW